MNKKFNVIFWMSVLVILFFGASYVYNNSDKFVKNSDQNLNNSGSANNDSSAQKAETAGTLSLENKQAPNFTIEDASGKSVSLSDYRGKVVVLNFWASWCPSCVKEMPDINALNQQFKQTGEAELLSINLTDGQRETKDIAMKYLKDNNFDMHVLFDTQNIANDAYKIYYIPDTIIIDKGGIVRKAFVGETNKDAILEVLKGLNK